jgi:hypothetical protein
MLAFSSSSSSVPSRANLIGQQHYRFQAVPFPCTNTSSKNPEHPHPNLPSVQKYQSTWLHSKHQWHYSHVAPRHQLQNSRRTLTWFKAGDEPYGWTLNTVLKADWVSPLCKYWRTCWDVDWTNEDKSASERGFSGMSSFGGIACSSSYWSTLMRRQFEVIVAWSEVPEGPLLGRVVVAPVGTTGATCLINRHACWEY